MNPSKTADVFESETKNDERVRGSKQKSCRINQMCGKISTTCSALWLKKEQCPRG